jgi:hypothetical protein
MSATRFRRRRAASPWRRRFRAGGTWQLDCRVESLGTAFFVSAPPPSVHLPYLSVRDGTSGKEPPPDFRGRLPQACVPTVASA